ncbi:MAG: hypothetical protein ACOX7J_05615 [Bacillota bacterium]|jgi:hypothetical protein
MNKEDFLDKLLLSYERSFDICRPYNFAEESYDAFGEFNVISAKYVLSKKAELWRANCYEYVFFKLTDTFDLALAENFQNQITGHIEPELVRKGEVCPPPNHMYSFVTGIFICESITAEAEKFIKNYKYIKNYRMTIRGYCEARLLIFDIKNQQIYGNRAAKDLIKGYKKIFQSYSR